MVKPQPNYEIVITALNQIQNIIASLFKTFERLSPPLDDISETVAKLQEQVEQWKH